MSYISVSSKPSKKFFIYIFGHLTLTYKVCIYIYIYIYIIMKTICPPGYHHNGFVATHALGHMMYGWEGTLFS